MDRSDPGSASEPSPSSSPRSPTSQVKRGSEDDLGEERTDGPKKIKMRDLDSVIRSEGIKLSTSECSRLKEAKPHGCHSKEEGISQITEANASRFSDRTVQVTRAHSPPERDVICLSLGPVGSAQSSSNLVSDLTSKQNNGTTRVDKEPEPHNRTSMGLRVDLNANPFHPYKKLGQVRSTDASECGSTTGPVESDPLRLWNEIKKNGFLSSNHGGIPIPKQRGRQPKRKRDDELKKKIDLAKSEPLCRLTKRAAPSGLLSGLNPGIIKHVRNSKQVNSIIEAIVRSENSIDQAEHGSSNQLGRGSKDIFERRKGLTYVHDSAATQFGLSLNRTCIPSDLEQRGHTSESYMEERMFHCENSTTQLKDEDETLTLKLSMASENASSVSNGDVSEGQENIASLSLTAANVACQWLELLQQDIKGRLAALRRSKKRVRNAIQTELPYLLSNSMSSNQENDPYFGRSSEAGCPKKEILDMHMARWKSIFSQMDKQLSEEGKNLESWLRQVEEMQSHCEKGLKYVETYGSSKLASSEEFSGPKKTEAVERECAVRAAAASIYSTCNLVMTTENVPCF